MSLPLYFCTILARAFKLLLRRGAMDERAALKEQIAALQQRLRKLELDSSRRPSAKLKQPPPVHTGKLGSMGPLPASLAARPKRHIALLFASVSPESQAIFSHQIS